MNDAPVLGSIERSALSYTENEAAHAVTATVTVIDEDQAALAGPPSRSPPIMSAVRICCRSSTPSRSAVRGPLARGR